MSKPRKLRSGTYATPPNGFMKLRGAQGYRDPLGNIWKKDRLHKDHWDVTAPDGSVILEVDFDGRELWPNGPKNKRKRTR